MTDIVKKIISINSQKNGAIVGVAGAKALSASEYIDEKHSLSSLNSDQSVVDINSLKDKYDDINYYDGDGSGSFAASAVVLTTGSSYSVPVGATTMKVWAIGGGGTWSHYCDSLNWGSAGGAGAVAVRTYSVTGGQSVTYSIGSGTIGGGQLYASCDATNVFAGSTTVTYGGISVSGNGGRTHRDGPTTNGTCTNATTCGVAGNDVDGLNAAVTLAGGSIAGRGAAGAGSIFLQPGNGGDGAIVLYFT